MTRISTVYFINSRHSLTLERALFDRALQTLQDAALLSEADLKAFGRVPGAFPRAYCGCSTFSAGRPSAARFPFTVRSTYAEACSGGIEGWAFNSQSASG